MKNPKNYLKLPLLLLLLANIASANNELTKGSLSKGSVLNSKYELAHLKMQLDGNLVLYSTINNYPIWNSGTVGRGDRLTMQPDGNLVLYDNSNQPLWVHRENMHKVSGFGVRVPYSKLIVQDDGNLVIYSPQGSPLYNTGTRLVNLPAISDKFDSLSKNYISQSFTLLSNGFETGNKLHSFYAVLKLNSSGVRDDLVQAVQTLCAHGIVFYQINNNGHHEKDMQNTFSIIHQTSKSGGTMASLAVLLKEDRSGDKVIETQWFDSIATTLFLLLKG